MSKRPLTAEELNEMPFTAQLMDADELRKWKEGRVQAGTRIKWRTCEVAYWQTNYFDPYEINAYLGQQCDYHDFSEEWFVRSPETEGWVNYLDLTLAVWQDLEVSGRLEEGKAEWIRGIDAAWSAADSKPVEQPATNLADEGISCAEASKPIVAKEEEER